jgi:DNA-binding LytR/AlgR family response regulator
MPAPMRTLIVDDEKLARERLHGFLAPLDGVEVVGEARNGPEALELIAREKPDLVFLDVQMPGMSGFEVLRELDGEVPHVVFATAHDEYAIQAFEVDAVDYLLKPFGRARVADAVERVRQRAPSDAAASLETLLGRLDGEERRLRRIPVHAGRRILLVAPEDVRWFGVEHRLVYAHLADRAHMTNFTLRELEERLDPATFFRAHKATLVNLAHVKAIVPWFGGRVKLAMDDTAGGEVVVSRAQARVLRARIKW